MYVYLCSELYCVYNLVSKWVKPSYVNVDIIKCMYIYLDDNDEITTIMQHFSVHNHNSLISLICMHWNKCTNKSSSVKMEKEINQINHGGMSTCKSFIQLHMLAGWHSTRTGQIILKWQCNVIDRVIIKKNQKTRQDAYGIILSEYCTHCSNRVHACIFVG